MKTKLIFIGLFIFGIVLLVSPTIFEKIFPSPRIIEIPVEVEKIVERVVYKPFATEVGEMTLTKQAEDMYILETKEGTNWSLRIEPQSNGQNAIVLRRAKE